MSKLNYLKDFFKVFLIFLPIFMLVIYVNYTVDPANLYKTRSFEKNVIATLKSGYNAAFPITMSQIDEVTVLKRSLENLQTSPNLIVMGSSRSFPINSSLFQGRSFYNASVSSCRMGDLIAIYNLLEKNKIQPDFLLLGIDPDSFVLSPLPKEDLFDDFWQASKKMRIGFSDAEKFDYVSKMFSYKVRKLLELFSPAYFQDSIKFLLIKKYGIELGSFNNDKVLSRNIPKMNYWVSTDNHAPGGVMFPDGSREFGDNQVLLQGNAKLQNTINLLKDMERIKTNSYLTREDSKKIFEAFIPYIRNHNINIILVLLPHHSIMYNYEQGLHGEQAAPIVVERYIRNYSQKYNIPVIGSYNLANIENFSDDDMVDHHHPRRSTIVKIFSR